MHRTIDADGRPICPWCDKPVVQGPGRLAALFVDAGGSVHIFHFTCAFKAVDWIHYALMHPSEAN